MSLQSTPNRLVHTYRELCEISLDIMLFFRTDGIIVHANQAALDAYGYTLDEIVDRSFYDIRVEEEWDSIPTQMERARQGSFRFETIHRRRDGTQFPVEATWSSCELEGTSVILSV